MSVENLGTNAGPWCGALTDTGVTVCASVMRSITEANLQTARDPQFRSDLTTFSSDQLWSDESREYEYKVLTCHAEGLKPNTKYYYRLVLNGDPTASIPGHFLTAPLQGSRSGFRFALSSCAKPSRRGVRRDEAYRAIANEPRTLFFMHMGDFHYENYPGSKIGKRLEHYDDALRRPGPGDLFRDLPTAYIWDDHDFLGNNSVGTGARFEEAGQIARKAYQTYTPHYPLANSNDGIYQAFQIANVRFLMLDTRSRKSEGSENRTMLGADQTNWLMQNLADGSQFDLNVIISSVPWIGDPDEDADYWAGYDAERASIAEFIVQNEIRNVCMISGDAHMVAIDDGANSAYATGGRGGFPVFQAASLESRPTDKGGPYTFGKTDHTTGSGVRGRRQFGVFDVSYRNEEEAPTVTWTAKRARKSSSVVDEVLQYSFPADRTYANF